MNKYHAIRTTLNGRTYASRAEAAWSAFYQNELSLGRLKALEYQPMIELLPRPNRVKYVADFKLTHLDGSEEYIDVKGVETDVFKLKKKMLAYFHPEIKLTIVR